MKIKLSAILITLALVAAFAVSCYPVYGDDGYKTMPTGTGTNAPAVLESIPATDEPTSSPEVSETEPIETSDLADQTTAADVTDSTVVTPEVTDEETVVPPVIITYEYDVIDNAADIGTTAGKTCKRILRYPKLKGLENASIQDSINGLLEQIATVEFENRLPNASELVSNGTAVDYEITDTSITYMGNNLLSVRSEGVIDYKDDSKDEKFAYCNLINLSTGRDITLKKTYSDFGSVMKLFTSGQFKQTSGDPSVVSSLTLEGLMEQYKYYSQYGTYPETYFTADSLIIVVETNRENGHFAEFSISLDSVNGYLYQSPTK